jgi:hypothetical protein
VNDSYLLRLLRNEYALLGIKGFALIATAAFLIFAAAPLLPSSPFLMDRTYLGACNWSLLLASAGWSLYYQLKSSVVRWFWLLVLAANTAVYLSLQLLGV